MNAINQVHEDSTLPHVAHGQRAAGRQAVASALVAATEELAPGLQPAPRLAAVGRPVIFVMVAVLPTLASYTLGGAVIVGGILVPLFLMVGPGRPSASVPQALPSSFLFFSPFISAAVSIMLVLPTGARLVHDSQS